MAEYYQANKEHLKARAKANYDRGQAAARYRAQRIEKLEAIRIRRAGPDSAANICCACFACNARKADMLPIEWLSVRPEVQTHE